MHVVRMEARDYGVNKPLIEATTKIQIKLTIITSLNNERYKQFQYSS